MSRASSPLSFDLPLGDVASALKSGAVAYVPVNPIEYHGPHLSLENDHLVSVGLAEDLHASIAKPGEPFVLARDLNVGVDPTFGPGTVATSYHDVKQAILDACAVLLEYGAKRVAFMTFHGSPNHAMALEAGVRYLRERGVRVISPLNELLRFLLEPDRATLLPVYACVDDAEERQAMLDDASSDFHGGFVETSLAMYYAPKSVRGIVSTLPPCPPLVPSKGYKVLVSALRKAGFSKLANELLLVGKAIAWTELRPFPGYTGRPHRASPEAGALLAELIRKRYVALAHSVLYGTGLSPAPVLDWMPVATMGGRVAPPPPTLADVMTFAAASVP